MKDAVNTKASYTVETGASEIELDSVTAAGFPGTSYAIFLTHGMGQPIPFQTIDHVAYALFEHDCREYGKDPETEPKPAARTLKSGDTWLSYIKLQLKAGEAAVEVHLYEGYWAPMTEGAINARNVMSFLADAGLNGVRHTAGIFRRWLFEQYPPVPVPVRTLFLLLAALATIVSLVVMNSTIAIIAGATAFLGDKPGWLTGELIADLTTTFRVVVTVLTGFGVSLLIGAFLRKGEASRLIRHSWGLVTWLLLVVTIWVVVPTGLAIPLMFAGHVGKWSAGTPFWHQTWLSPASVAAFDTCFDWTVLALAVAVVVGVGYTWLRKIGTGLEEEFRQQPRGKRLTLLVAALFVVLVSAALAIGIFFLWKFLAHTPEPLARAEYLIAWPLLVAISAYIRLILVQYVGDVAIYIMPYKLDAFANLRRAIKQRVYEAARAVYQQERYDKVIVVGHSLGSVIAYDVLNMLILDDTAMKAEQITGKDAGKPDNDAKGEKSASPEKAFLDVVRRTPLFLTFGSPLDKTAFVFAVQAKGTSEGREALAGSVQPMIVDYRFRPERWINIWSPWDIISGSLELYDFPIEGQEKDVPPETLERFKRTRGKRVDNKLDPNATTLLVAHTEYWENPLLTKTIYDALDARASARRR